MEGLAIRASTALWGVCVCVCVEIQIPPPTPFVKLWHICTVYRIAIKITWYI